jgi:DNA polymerase delta subunit 2
LFLPGPDVRIRKLFELEEAESAKCVILGTLFKHQELKPSILKEISEEVCVYTLVLAHY